MLHFMGFSSGSEVQGKMFLSMTEVYGIITAPEYLSTDLCASDCKKDIFKHTCKIQLGDASASYQNASNTCTAEILNCQCRLD